MADGRCLNRIAQRLEKIASATTKILEEGTIDNVYVNMQLLEEIWSEYKSLENRIKFDDDITKAMDGLEDNYLTTSKEPNNDCTMQELLTNQRSVLEEAMRNKRDDEIRLPRINIPTFSGVYSEFPSFRDLFQASVGRKTNISGVQKLQYLKGLLVGDAAALTRHIETTDANYEEAWSIIKQRFDNKRYVLANLLKKFTDQPSVVQPSARALHHISDVMEEVSRGLKAVGPQAETRDPWLIFILLNKLDTTSKQAWALDMYDEDFPTLEQFKRFLNKRGTALGDCETKRSTYTTKPETGRIRTAMHVTQKKNLVCPKCYSEHNLYKCDRFLELDVSSRRGFIAEQRLCFNCLRTNHQAANCRSYFRCNKCKSKHHTVLHPNTPQAENENKKTPDARDKDYQNYQANICNDQQLKVNAHTSNNFQALLPTAIVKIRDSSGKFQYCRLLLDSGAQASFISENCIQRLKLPRQNANFSIKGITSDAVRTRGMASITLFSCYDDQQVGIDALILNELPTKLPSQHINVSSYNEINSLQLADPGYPKPSHIDIMIGANKFFNVLCEGRIEINEKSLVAQNTIFGWVIAGEVNHCTTEDTPKENWSYNFHARVNINNTDTLQRKSNLLSRTPFIGEDGILRVNRRLQKLISQYDLKYPIILPKSHNLSRMIISYVQSKYLHPGPFLTSHLIGQKYWIVRGKSLVSDELKRSFRQRATTAHPLMGKKRRRDKKQLIEVFKKLKSKVFNHIIAEHLVKNSIQWHSIPPPAPDFEDLRQAAVKLVKSHFNRAIDYSTPLSEDDTSSEELIHQLMF